MTISTAAAAPARSTEAARYADAFAAAQAQFAAETGYLAACTMGLAPRPVVAALREDLVRWTHGMANGIDYGSALERGRAAFARIAGVPIERVATGSQSSVMASLVAAAVPDGAEIVCVDGDFSSIVFPFLQQAHRGVTVRHVPLEALADSLDERSWLVAFSLVQSATGAIADARAVLEASARHHVRTLVDLTQAAGWMPVDAGRFDVTITHAYKWLCAPRGAALMTVSPGFASLLRPVQAGWYAGADPWASCYGPEMELAADARRFDVSPAWQAWAGAAPALELFAALDAGTVHRHAGGLGDALCRGLGLPEHGQAIVSWADAEGSALRALTDAGLTASGRAGRVRVAFHLWNDERDVEAVLRALRS